MTETDDTLYGLSIRRCKDTCHQRHSPDKRKDRNSEKRKVVSDVENTVRHQEGYVKEKVGVLIILLTYLRLTQNESSILTPSGICLNGAVR